MKHPSGSLASIELRIFIKNVENKFVTHEFIGNFSLHHRIQTGSEVHPGYPMGIRASSPGGEADQSPPSSAEVKNAWSYTSTPPIRLHVVVLS
jgi:hypothetical protein